MELSEDLSELANGQIAIDALGEAYFSGVFLHSMRCLNFLRAYLERTEFLFV